MKTMRDWENEYYTLDMESEGHEYYNGGTDFYVPIFVPETLEHYIFLVEHNALEYWQGE